MSKVRKFLVAVAFLLGAFAAYEVSDEALALVYGSPVRLVSASGPLETVKDGVQLEPSFQHVMLNQGNLRIAVRSGFTDAGTFARPYLTVNGSGEGRVHISMKPRVVLLGLKCEFIRQFEVELSAAQWKPLKSLAIVYGDSNSTSGERIDLADAHALNRRFIKSDAQVAMRDISGVGPGCVA